MSRAMPHKTGFLPALLAGLLSLIFLALYFTPVQDYISKQVSRPLEFRFRAWVGQSPVLDPRIKIFAFDDQTVSYLGYHDLTLDGWQKLASEAGWRR